MVPTIFQLPFSDIHRRPKTATGKPQEACLEKADAESADYSQDWWSHLERVASG